MSIASNPKRKTKFTLKSVRHNGRWLCVDSTAPNAFVEFLATNKSFSLLSGYKNVKREHTIGKHRFDLFLTDDSKSPFVVEVKSVTLVEGGVAKFPDAPTERGRAHLLALSQLVAEGYKCAVMFVILRSDAKSFEPNVKTDPDFVTALGHAKKAGVIVTAVRASVGRRSMNLFGDVPVRLG